LHLFPAVLSAFCPARLAKVRPLTAISVDSKQTELSACFVEGMERVASTIDGIVDFEPIIGHKIPAELREKIDQQESREIALEFAIEYTLATLRSAKPVTYVFPDVDVLLFGRTKNNLREFNFVLSVIDERGILVIANAADLPQAKKAATAYQEFADAFEPDVRRYFRGRASVNAGLVFQLAQYVVNFVRYHLSQSISHKKPGLAIVANDHSPTAVAFAQSMKFFNVPRLYVQHAEVSPSFPPLNFELSVLRNERSKRIYKERGQSPGDVFVISRFSEPFKSPQVQANCVGPQPVVVYTTGRVEPAALASLCAKLQSNSHVASVVVKAHPNQGLVEWPDGVEVVNELVRRPHIAIVGNSSVAIELLQRGVPVFQNFTFDPIEADYYGFVRAGIVPSISLDELSERFWRGARFDSDWYQKFSDAFSPSPRSSYAEAQRLRASISALKISWPPRPNAPFTVETRDGPHAAIVLSNKLKKRILSILPRRTVRGISYLYRRTSLNSLVAFQAVPKHESSTLTVGRSASSTSGISGSASNEFVVEWARYSISSSKYPAEWLKQSLSLGIFTTEDAIRAIDQMYQQRQPAVYDLFDCLQVFEGTGTLYYWLALKRLDISGVAAPFLLQQLIDYTLQLPEGYVRASLEGLAFNSCLRLNDLSSLEALLRRGSYVCQQSLSTTRRVALLRHYGRFGPRETYVRLREEFWLAETPLHRLKIEDLDASISPVSERRTHEEVERKYVAAVNAAALTDYKNFIEPAYTRLRPRMRFMDVRSSAGERDSFYELVIGVLESKGALSMMRLGDGEAYALAAREGIFSDTDRQNRERHWWGVELEAKHREVICARVRKAVRSADILGVPSIHRFVRDTLDKSKGFAQSIQGRGLMQVLTYLAEADERPLIGEDRMNLALFRTSDVIRPLLSAADRCVVVSSAAANALPQWMNEITEIVRVEIPTHQRTSRNQKYAMASVPLPYVYEEVDAKVRESVSPGTLVLVAAGVVGKIFIDTAKSAGGVALDLGSVMDEWLDAGIHSLN
jgi:hypothetical protein